MKIDMKTLKPDQKCKVRVVEPETEEELGIFDAIYRSENAEIMGWDFEIPSLAREGTMEVVEVFSC